MPNATVQLSADIAAKNLTLDISEHNSVRISYETEADFTDLVERLLLLMDQDLQIDLLNTVKKGDDQKLNLAVETIEEIIESYNNSFESDEGPIGQQAPDENDDLPF